MTETTTITREQYLSMIPATFLADGFRDAEGNLRPEVGSIWATAGAVQMETIAPRIVSTMVEALKQTLPLHEGAPAARYRTACEEAAEVAGGILGKPAPAELVAWLARYASSIHSEADLQDLLHHLTETARQHALFSGMRGAR